MPFDRRPTPEGVGWVFKPKNGLFYSCICNIASYESCEIVCGKSHTANGAVLKGNCTYSVNLKASLKCTVLKSSRTVRTAECIATAFTKVAVGINNFLVNIRMAGPTVQGRVADVYTVILAASIRVEGVDSTVYTACFDDIPSACRPTPFRELGIFTTNK